MRKILILAVAALMIAGVTAVTGCGEKTETVTTGDTVTFPDTSTTPQPSDTTVEDNGTKAAATPREVVEAYCEALINDQYEVAKGFWDVDSLDRFLVSTNALDQVDSVTVSGTDGEQHVVAVIRYTQCESGEVLGGTIEFTLEEKDGLWKITDADPDYE